MPCVIFLCVLICSYSPDFIFYVTINIYSSLPFEYFLLMSFSGFQHNSLGWIISKIYKFQFSISGQHFRLESSFSAAYAECTLKVSEWTPVHNLFLLSRNDPKHSNLSTPSHLKSCIIMPLKHLFTYTGEIFMYYFFCSIHFFCFHCWIKFVKFKNPSLNKIFGFCIA